MDASATKLPVNLNKVLSQLKSLDKISKDNNWVFRVNDLDQAIYSSERVPSGSYLWSFDDEKYLYLDKESNVNGFFIEYFSTNFLEHETKYKPILKELKQTRSGSKVISNSKTSERILNELEQELFLEFSKFKKSVGSEYEFTL